VPTLYRSRDGGATFAVIPGAPGVRALSVRGTMLYAATDNFGNGYAVGASTNEGDTWQALMSYSDVKGIIPCLKSACQVTCSAEVTAGLWTDAVCSADLPAGSGGAGGVAGAGTGGGGGASSGVGGHGGGGAPASSGGGGCSAAGGGDDALPLLWLSGALAAAWCLARRGRTIRDR
jgi:hypothetical protein